MSLDPEDDVAPGDTTSQNASGGRFQKAWNEWTSRPENNAALLQFGISMLQPRAPGQSGVGAFANSIGSAGEAVGRVNTQTRADEAQASLEADKEANRTNQATTAESGRITANAYADSVKNSAANPKGGGGLAANLRMQQGFRSWMAKVEDTTGMQADPILGAVQKKFPNVKTKADLLADSAARAEAFRVYSQVAPEAIDEGTPGTPPSPSSPASTAPIVPQGTPRTIYDGAGKAYTWDGIQGHAPVPQ